MEYAYKITTQNVEEYGENFYKYKVVLFTLSNLTQPKRFGRKSPYGEGKHEYYYPPSLTEATACISYATCK